MDCYLAADNYAVTRLADALRNTPGREAPMIQLGTRLFQAPDVQATKAGQIEYWEVKYRTRSEVNRTTGQSEYWISQSTFNESNVGCRVRSQEMGFPSDSFPTSATFVGKSRIFYMDSAPGGSRYLNRIGCNRSPDSSLSQGSQKRSRPAFVTTCSPSRS
jgi:hypothetical protein